MKAAQQEHKHTDRNTNESESLFQRRGDAYLNERSVIQHIDTAVYRHSKRHIVTARTSSPGCPTSTSAVY